MAQIEYIIVSFDDTNKNALLALSQTEILHKLAGVVEGMNCDVLQRSDCLSPRLLTRFALAFRSASLSQTFECPS